MVFESYYWKRDLLKLARKLKKRKSPELIWGEADYGEFEKEIMIGFYIIRKLTDAYKLSDRTISTKIEGRRIPSFGKVVHIYNRDKITSYFDFTKAKNYKFDIAFLVNQLIHSYVFSPFFNEHEHNFDFSLAGIHFCSDKYRNEYLFELPIDTIIGLYTHVGNDYPAIASVQYDEKKKDFKINNHNDSKRTKSGK